jgi:hypothetical protein
MTDPHQVGDLAAGIRAERKEGHAAALGPLALGQAVPRTLHHQRPCCIAVVERGIVDTGQVHLQQPARIPVRHPCHEADPEHIAVGQQGLVSVGPQSEGQFCLPGFDVGSRQASTHIHQELAVVGQRDRGLGFAERDGNRGGCGMGAGQTHQKTERDHLPRRAQPPGKAPHPRIQTHQSHDAIVAGRMGREQRAGQESVTDRA